MARGPDRYYYICIMYSAQIQASSSQRRWSSEMGNMTIEERKEISYETASERAN